MIIEPRILTGTVGAIERGVLPFIESSGRARFIAVKPGNQVNECFYEKALKVEADVAAILNYCFRICINLRG